jgi:hypothetical protein
MIVPVRFVDGLGDDEITSIEDAIWQFARGELTTGE